jgi:hypothetical protein
MIPIRAPFATLARDAVSAFDAKQSNDYERHLS